MVKAFTSRLCFCRTEGNRPHFTGLAGTRGYCSSAKSQEKKHGKVSGHISVGVGGFRALLMSKREHIQYIYVVL